MLLISFSSSDIGMEFGLDKCAVWLTMAVLKKDCDDIDFTGWTDD